MSNVLDNYFPLGFGTTRLPISSVNDTYGIEKSAALITKALERGVDYIDTAYSYSYGGALRAVGIALKTARKPVCVTVKSMYGLDKTADDAKNRAFMQLNELGLAATDFFVCWNILSFEIFREITRKGGIYDGAMRLKAEGIIKHISCSLHTDSRDSIKIINSGAFESVTISYNLLNAASMQGVLNAAYEKNIAVAVMNPLAGGLIAQNPDFFSYARGTGENTATAAIRFAKAHPAVNIVLSGINSEDELEENISALRKVFLPQCIAVQEIRSERTLLQPEKTSELTKNEAMSLSFAPRIVFCQEYSSLSEDKEPADTRLRRVLAAGSDLKGICTGCDYCAGCPQNIPVSVIMRARNKLLFGSNTDYNRRDSELCRNINLFYRLDYLPSSAENLCVKCGLCERKCTQKLNIIEGIADFYRRVDEGGYSELARKERIKLIFADKNIKKAGLFPSGGFANLVMETHKTVFGDTGLEWILFNNNKNLHNTEENGLVIRPPSDIVTIKPDIIIVCSYKYDDEISKQLSEYEKNGIKIIKLHTENDVPWLW